MSFSYSGDPSTSDKDAVRFAIGDTDATDPLLQDEEINFILTKFANVTLAAAVAADRIAAIFSRKADRTIGDFSERFSQISDAFFDLAKQLRLEATGSTRPIPLVTPFAGGISVSDKRARESNTDRVKPIFERGETDFPGANLDRDVDTDNDING